MPAAASRLDELKAPAVGWLAAALCAGLSLYALYWTQFSINTSVYRATFLGLVLAAAFLIYPARKARVIDWLCIALVIASIFYLVTHLEATKTRATAPLEIEIWLGGGLILMVLEATRRATGWALPLIAAGFIAYGLFGPWMPDTFTHRGFSPARIIGQNYLSLEGIFSTPMDVAATFIIVFSLYGAVLDKGGACGKRLDFLCQELNREANTLGSKSVANEMTRISVELKVLIEQMREQVQNIE